MLSRKLFVAVVALGFTVACGETEPTDSTAEFQDALRAAEARAQAEALGEGNQGEDAVQAQAREQAREDMGECLEACRPEANQAHEACEAAQGERDECRARGLAAAEPCHAACGDEAEQVMERAREGGEGQGQA
ncbi:MAG: hypothetical protein KC613_17420, partial [Myxococcales bacterium]|nr:hypothetical protein [Myxococcales bacterium]